MDWGLRFPIVVGNDYCYGSGMTAVIWLAMTAVMWLGMMIVLMTGAEITMRLSLGMMFLITEVFRLRISLKKRNTYL